MNGSNLKVKSEPVDESEPPPEASNAGGEEAMRVKVEEPECEPSSSSSSAGDDLRALGLQGVTAFSADQVEHNLVHSLGLADSCEDGSRFDRLMATGGQQAEAASAAKQERPAWEEESDAEDGEAVFSSDEFVPSDGEDVEEGFVRGSVDAIDYAVPGPSKPKKVKRKRVSVSSAKAHRDDSNDADFEARIREYRTRRAQAVCEGQIEEGTRVVKDDLVVASEVWTKLFRYQKTGVRWLAELDTQCVGGILADEMGLGKTVQTLAFLRALDDSQRENNHLAWRGLGPVLLVCPATLLHQWVSECHTWLPLARVAVLHASGSWRGSKRRLVEKWALPRSGGSVLITSYSTFTKERQHLAGFGWHYVILDEGHKIRNPEAQATMALKELRTPHRLILSGSPMQNALKELWSLIDFVYPGRLGSLKSFSDKFAVPITQGGYANANEIQTATAYKCALVLRDAINPFILRRLKKDVQESVNLPGKNEQVLFCEITPHQRHVYKEYLASRECGSILSGRLDAFVGLISLRKICNHPDLVTGGPNRSGDYNLIERPEMEFGWPSRSGKMMVGKRVVRSLLHLWKKAGHKVLLFSQSRQMLNILETMMIAESYSYLRMDGATAIGSRQRLVQQFNEDSSIFVFLLTTRVGGLGVNLTGANKVLIFDPDWNPSTDAQARERAWRIGQQREVTIYRLLCSGTIEEKIYHRQVFKQFLANRVLKDPKQKQFFKTNDLHELFTLAEPSIGSDALDAGTETGALFAGETEEIHKGNWFDAHQTKRDADREKKRRKKKDKKGEKEQEKKEEEGEQVEEEEKEEKEEGEVSDEEGEGKAPALTEERRERLREMARRLSRDMSQLSKENGEGGIKDGVFEGKYNVPFLVKQKKAKKSEEERKREKEEKRRQEKASDDYVLGRLLESSGVRSAIRHDDVIGEKPNSLLVEREAASVAKQAAASIRNKPSRSLLMQLCGKRSVQRVQEQQEAEREEAEPAMFSGESGGGSFLQAVLNRKRRHGDGDDLALPKSSKPSRMADSIQRFLVSRGGRAETQEIVARFKKEIGAADQIQFRALLKQLATKEKGKWRLKEEYL